MPELDIWYDGMHVDSLLGYFEPADRGRVSVHIDEARSAPHPRGAYDKLTEVAHGRPRITEDPPVRTTVDDDEQVELVDDLLAGYRSHAPGGPAPPLRPVHRGRRGPPGGRVWGASACASTWSCSKGRSGGDPLFLQCKQAGPSVYEAHLGPSAHGNHGARVVTGKRLVQSATDIFVGWARSGATTTTSGSSGT